MTDLDRVFEAYKAEAIRSGRAPDPTGYLAELPEPAARDTLAALIDGYLARRPRRRFDRARFEADGLEPLVDGLAAAEAWTTLLPRLRHEAQITRSDLVTRLAERLGVAGRRDRVGDYYHRMEQGALPADGIADRVLEALGELLHASAARLRAAGRVAPPPAAAGGVYARAALSDESFAAAAPPPASVLRQQQDLERDEVDELFTGGA